jgi:hypothetical protein
MSKKWYKCIDCYYKKQCPGSKTRLEGVDPNSYAALEVGCFDFEIYFSVIDGKQLRLVD